MAYLTCLHPGVSDMPSRLVFITNTGTSSATEQMRITAAGDVGIGETAPAAKLDVDGDISATTTITGAAGIVHPGFTTTSLTDKTHAVNTANKVAGLTVFNSTNGILYCAIGASDVSVWRKQTDGTDITPV